MEPQPTHGRIVHYVLPPEYDIPAHRPAMIVQAWEGPTQMVNIQVFLDGTNDRKQGVSSDKLQIWATSVKHDENMTPGTWHWPERD